MDVAELSAGLERASTLDERLEVVCRPLSALGFSAFTYDYSPVPLSHDGHIITPTLIKLRNAPDDFADLWLGRGYVQIDPVQALAIRSLAPFAWSLASGGNQVLRHVLSRDHAPVVSYLLDNRLSCGVTVPMHLPGGALATFTAITAEASLGFQMAATSLLGEISLLGTLFNETVCQDLDQRTRTCPYIRLTRRERECLQWCARGLTVKETAYRLDRSHATVALHIRNAARKLGAHNRTQAVARAAYYHLLDGAC